MPVVDTLLIRRLRRDARRTKRFILKNNKLSHILPRFIASCTGD
jgi:hypothetical protein